MEPAFVRQSGVVGVAEPVAAAASSSAASSLPVPTYTVPATPRALKTWHIVVGAVGVAALVIGTVLFSRELIGFGLLTTGIALKSYLHARDNCASKMRCIDQNVKWQQFMPLMENFKTLLKKNYSDQLVKANAIVAGYKAMDKTNCAAPKMLEDLTRLIHLIEDDCKFITANRMGHDLETSRYDQVKIRIQSVERNVDALLQVLPNIIRNNEQRIRM